MLFLAVLAAATELPSDARPQSNPAIWIRYQDLPSERMAVRPQGALRFHVNVDAEGKAIGCAIDQTSGDSAIDERACAIIMSNARFFPARNAIGDAVPGQWRNAFRWSVPAGSKPIEQIALNYAFDIEYKVDNDGRATACRPIKAEGLPPDRCSQTLGTRVIEPPVVNGRSTGGTVRLRSTRTFVPDG